MFTKQIAKGVALLDEKVPGWLDEVNVDDLDMECGVAASRLYPCGCVLAQTDPIRSYGYGSYIDHLERLGLADGRQAKSYGFRGRNGRPWRTLTAEWKATILRLRKERS